MRALVISDTHFGAWTGYDLLRDRQYIERLAPHLDRLDEVVFLGDLYDLLFGTIEGAFSASEGLLHLVRENLQGRRIVFLAGNHDHHVEVRRAESLIELRLAGVESGELDQEVARRSVLRSFLARHLEGVEVDVRYPTYTVGDVLLTHGHYLDPHARQTGALGSRVLTQTLWRIAAGGREDPRTVDDYESVITLLTELLFTIAQLPHGCSAERSVNQAAQRFGGVANAVSSPIERGRRRIARTREERATGRRAARTSDPEYRRAQASELERRRAIGGPALNQGMDYSVARVLRPSDPRERSLEALSKVVANLGWADATDKIVFGHTHQPLADVRAPGDDRVRYWNTGCWIYEPDLSSPEAYDSYLERAWPGTAILIDTDEPQPRLIETMADLNPLNGGPGIESTPARA